MTEEHVEGKPAAEQAVVSEVAPAKPGTALIGWGLGIAGVTLLVVFFMLLDEGALIAVIPGGFILGLLLAAIGFCRRVLAALEAK